VIHYKEEWNRRFLCNVTPSTYMVIQEESSIFWEVI